MRGNLLNGIDARRSTRRGRHQGLGHQDPGTRLHTGLGKSTRRGPGRPRGAGRRRRRGSTRADQAVKLIKQNPGITASEIARKMSIQPNYLYRVLGDLQKEGKVKKSGRSYTAA